MGSAGVVEVDPVSDCPGCVLEAFEAMAMNALLFKRPDHPFDHSVLLRTVRRDELFFEAIASDEARVIAARKNQAIIGTQQERVCDLPE